MLSLELVAILGVLVGFVVYVMVVTQVVRRRMGIAEKEAARHAGSTEQPVKTGH